MAPIARTVAWLALLGAATARGQPPAAPAAPAAAVAFDPRAAAPYFQGGAGAEARRRFAVEDWAGAARLFGEEARAPRGGERVQAEFLQAQALARAGRFVDAAALYERLGKTYPLLADHHHLGAARAYLAAASYPRAIARARAVSPGSPLLPEARLVVADALRLSGGGALAEAEAAYRGYLADYPDSWRAPEARFRLARLLEDPTRPAPRAAAERLAEARKLYRFLYIQSPTSSWAGEARTRLLALGDEALALSGAEHLTRGLALFEQMRNEPSEVELAAAVDGVGLEAAQRCQAAWHRAQSVFKQRNRPRAAPLFDQAVALCEKAPAGDAVAADFHAKGLYQSGRCHAAMHEPGAALDRFARLYAEHPTHSYADDARVRSAEILQDVVERLPARQALLPAAIGAGPLPPPRESPIAVAQATAAVRGLDGKPVAATADSGLDRALLEAARDRLLNEVPGEFPGGDMAGEALFRLAFRAFEERRLEEARAVLERELALLPREEGWWEAGRTLYWLGRVAAEAGRPRDAAALYTRAAREYPLGFYALLALNRLREASPDEEQRLVGELGQPAASAADLAWSFAPDPLYAQPGFARGVELARLGLGAEARRELSAVGIRGEKKGARVDDPARAERLWLAAVLYDSAGEWSLSHAIPRHVLQDHARRWPAGDNRKRWLISFPRGYRQLVEQHAADNGQPAALQYAIIREESAFDPLDESFANAVGLTQLTQAPAKRFARGLPFSREALHDPVINITIGARELGDLWHKAGGAAPLCIASYNAGEGAVHRWLAAAPSGLALDEFIERIPYDETRGYTKRVLGSWFAYHWLYQEGDPVPRLPAKLPR